MLLTTLRHLSIKALAFALLEAFGALWLVVEISANFSQAFAADVKPYWWVFLLVGIVMGLYRAWPRLTVSASVSGTDCSITIRVCEMFKVTDAALVVGTNTTFDTALEDGTIDRTSVQGQLTTKLFATVAQLDLEIADSLKTITSVPLAAGKKPYGKQNLYDVGTVANVLPQGRRAYLVAIATLNANRAAHATLQSISDALPRLWEHIRTHAGLQILCCPILGSGFSRLDATREELIHEIVKSFIPAAKAGTLCRALIIAVSPKDYRDGHLDLRRLGQYLEHECTYGSSARSTIQGPAVGIPQS
jgi:hypothetical protein